MVSRLLGKGVSKAIGKKEGKPTQRIFRKKYKAEEGAGKDPETDRSVSARRSVDSSVKQGNMKVTRGRESMDKGVAEAGRTAGQRNLAKTKVQLQQDVNRLEKIKDKTDAQKRELASAKRKLKSMETKETSDYARSVRKSAATRTGQKRERTGPNLVFDKDTGEINMTEFKKLTPRQQERQIEAAKAYASTAKIRTMKALAESKKETAAGRNIKAGDVKKRIRGEELYKGGSVKGKRNGKK